MVAGARQVSSWRCWYRPFRGQVLKRGDGRSHHLQGGVIGVCDAGVPSGRRDSRRAQQRSRSSSAPRLAFQGPVPSGMWLPQECEGPAVTSHQKPSPRHYLLCFPLRAVLFGAEETQTRSCVGSHLYGTLVTLRWAEPPLWQQEMALGLCVPSGGHAEACVCAR